VDLRSLLATNVLLAKRRNIDVLPTPYSPHKITFCSVTLIVAMSCRAAPAAITVDGSSCLRVHDVSYSSEMHQGHQNDRFELDSAQADANIAE